MIQSRADLIDYCLRALGAPVLEINVDEEQVEDRIDEALQFYRDFHSDAVIRNYRKHKLTQQDIENRFITLPENVIFVSKVFPLNSVSDFSSGALFDINYQIQFDSIHNLNYTGGLIDYTMMKQYMRLIDMTLNPEAATSFNRHMNRLFIETNWDQMMPDIFILIDLFETVDPEEFVKIYNDRWLKKYCIALIQKQWGMNLIKFGGMQLPGGVTIDGQTILNEAKENVEKLEEQIRLEHELPVDFLIG